MAAGGGAGLIMTLMIDSETLAALSAFSPSTLVSKLTASVPASYAWRIFAMITSSERPNFVISMTSWLVSRLRSEVLSWPPAKPNANETRKKASNPTLEVQQVALITSLYFFSPVAGLRLPVEPDPKRLVGAIGFEPTTPCAQGLHARIISDFHRMIPDVMECYGCLAQ